MADLFAGHRIAHQCHICQLRETLQHIQIGELSDIVLGQHQRVQVRQALGQVVGEQSDAVLRAKQCLQSWRCGKVVELDEVVVCEVEALLVLHIDMMSILPWRINAARNV